MEILPSDPAVVLVYKTNTIASETIPLDLDGYYKLEGAGIILANYFRDSIVFQAAFFEAYKNQDKVNFNPNLVNQILLIAINVFQNIAETNILERVSFAKEHPMFSEILRSITVQNLCAMVVFIGGREGLFENFTLVELQILL